MGPRYGQCRPAAPDSADGWYQVPDEPRRAVAVRAVDAVRTGMARLLSVLSAPGAGIMRPGVLYAFLGAGGVRGNRVRRAASQGRSTGRRASGSSPPTHIIEHPIQRLTILKQVAHTPKLTQHEQTYLVNAIFQGGFGSDQADALVALLRNPCCTPDTREEIRKKLKSPRAPHAGEKTSVGSWPCWTTRIRRSSRGARRPSRPRRTRHRYGQRNSGAAIPLATDNQRLTSMVVGNSKSRRATTFDS